MKNIFLLLCAFTLLFPGISTATEQTPAIESITVAGNSLVRTETILHSMPYQVGGQYREADSGRTIEKIYALGAFRQIVIEKEARDNNTVALFVTVTEKPQLTGITFEGNHGISTQKLTEIAGTANLQTVDESSAALLANRLKKEYRDNDYHHVRITPYIEQEGENKNRASLRFVIEEQGRSKIRTIRFQGNTTLSERALRGHLMSHENWLFGFLSGAGTYNPDMLEYDKQVIGMLYNDHGHLTAQVTDTKVTFADDGSNSIDILFTIHEGPVYTIKEIGISPDPDVPPFVLNRFLQQQAGDVYKASALRETMQALESFYGQQGYIDVRVNPSIIPEANANFVSVFFNIEKGERWRLNRINITGNFVTQDHVIRRQIELEEGDVITTFAMDRSKNNVEYLSYFDEQNGVNWKKHRVGKDLIDLELQVKEKHQREFGGGLDFGPGKGSSEEGIKMNCYGKLNNVGGLGWDTSFLLRGSRKGFSQFSFNIIQPYLLESGVGCTLDVSYQKMIYEQWRWVSPEPTENVFGVTGALHIPLPFIDRRLSLRLESGFELTRNNKFRRSTQEGVEEEVPNLSIINVHPSEHPRMQALLDQKLQPGTLKWIGIDLVKNTRNHPVYPNDGYRLALSTKWAPPGINSTFQYLKTTLNASWYTPLIGTDSLVLCLHGQAGYAENTGSGSIPYRELFNLGGQHTLRGFTWGQVAPSWDYQNPLGGKKSLYFGAELIFPVLNNYNMKMHLFYEAGSAWNTPREGIVGQYASHIRNDNFNLRHTVGIGLNIIRPQPMKISFGYKLDRNGKLNERPYEFHIGMNTAF